MAWSWIMRSLQGDHCGILWKKVDMEQEVIDKIRRWLEECNPFLEDSSWDNPLKSKNLIASLEDHCGTSWKEVDMEQDFKDIIWSLLEECSPFLEDSDLTLRARQLQLSLCKKEDHCGTLWKVDMEQEILDTIWSWLEDCNPFLEDSDLEEEEAAAATAAAAVSVTPVLEATTQTSWVTPLLNSGPVPRIDAMATNTMGWSTPSEDSFVVRGSDYATTKAKVPATESILQPLAFDWLSSSARIDNVLEHPNNRVMLALEDELKLGRPQPFVWVFNLQVPSPDHLSAIAYFVMTEKCPEGSLVSQFLKDDGEFRVSRLKLIANVCKGPWIVKAAVGEQAVCILGKALTCRFSQSEKHMSIDVDIGSSMVATGVVQLAIGYVTTLTVDIAFLLEGQTLDELPERLLGSIRLHNLELKAAVAIPTLDLSRGGVSTGEEETRAAGQTSVLQISVNSPRGAIGRPASKSKCSRLLATIRGGLTCFSPSKCAP